MSDLHTTAQIENYLQRILGASAKVLRQSALGKPGKEDLKGFGYGTPVLIEYELAGKRKKAVLHTVRPGPFGHEHMSDRAQSLLWEHSAFNNLPRHVRSIDVGAFRQDRTTVSLGDAEEFFTVTHYGEGRPYAEDLERILTEDKLREPDLQRADALCDYLTEIHSATTDQSGLYVRRIRELVGHSECIMGLIDNYPPEQASVYAQKLKPLELQCVDWRWKLKNRIHRIRQVHGDFHPWNILFSEGPEFCVLDRSRGEWGDPADDITCLTMNYLFFSLQKFGRLEGPFETLFLRFWKRYLEKSKDEEILEVAAPFFVFRGLVLAHPVWYPHVESEVRDKIFSFMNAVLDTDAFKPEEVNQYCGA